MRIPHTLFALAMASVCIGQVQLERSLLAANGRSAQAGNVQLDYSLGDLVVSTATAPGSILTQGFHQTTYDFSTSVGEATSNDLTVFPNPTRDHVTILWTGAVASAAMVELQDLLGQVLWTGRRALGAPFDLDLSGHAPGAYFIRVNPVGGVPTVVRVQKVD